MNMNLYPLNHDREVSSNTQRPSIYAPYIIGKQGKILATLYTPDSQEPRPVLIFAHGFPGHEKNMDLAQALRRIGFNVLIYFYSGCWGSDGAYSFANSIDDTYAVLDYVLCDCEYNLDKNNIFFLGHSMGCFAAAKALIARPEIKGCVFLMPSDLGRLYHLSKVDEGVYEFLASLFDEGAQWLNGTDRLKLMEEVEENPGYYTFDSMITELAQKPILWVSGKKDEIVPESIHSIPFMERLKAYPGHKIVWRRLNTDHFFSDIRIQLSYEIANFLSGLVNLQGASRFVQANFVSELKALLDKEYKTLTLSAAADYFNISVPYLSRLIHEKTGENFISLLTEIKMNKAKELLLDTRLSIGEIAECLGYNDSTYFMKSFKKYYNYTPTLYRNKHCQRL